MWRFVRRFKPPSIAFVSPTSRRSFQRQRANFLDGKRKWLLGLEVMVGTRVSRRWVFPQSDSIEATIFAPPIQRFNSANPQHVTWSVTGVGLYLLWIGTAKCIWEGRFVKSSLPFSFFPSSPSFSSIMPNFSIAFLTLCTIGGWNINHEFITCWVRTQAKVIWLTWGRLSWIQVADLITRSLDIWNATQNQIKTIGQSLWNAIIGLSASKFAKCTATFCNTTACG